ncbi:MAG: glutamine-hydrolyzing carbamoyl-phosphate synthase small subunit [Acidobacteriota bacterium]|nr:glutamine-hydrolyzing carbamoyl-phosphate synthase small subunit [Blastocatellia bacterium]MDW8412849.1 glutamine-hydrolyzing carbamoyl-phosphate synthase small subunit [Acidobacteriota bacterium]
MKNRTTYLVLEDGTCFKGYSFGACGEKTAEVVFNTSITGYQEILTDPSYAGQIVVLTYPEIGNYGVNLADEQSRRPFVEGLVVRNYSARASNWRSELSLSEYLAKHGVIGIAGVDTRRLVRHIREHGAMRGIISTEESDRQKLLDAVLQSPKMLGRALVEQVTCSQPYSWLSSKKSGLHVVAYDFGIKRAILNALAERQLRITVVPADTTAEQIDALCPDGIFLSNGPGDPQPLTQIARQVRRLAEKYPTFGICLGHQILAIAFGARTYKMKFGHRGGNQPVKNLLTGKVEISAHNHGFAVDASSLPQELEVTHVNLNDGTIEGLRHRYLPVYSVQYHPEAAPGPHDSLYLFDYFYQLVSKCQAAKVAG